MQFIEERLPAIQLVETDLYKQAPDRVQSMLRAVKNLSFVPLDVEF